VAHTTPLLTSSQVNKAGQTLRRWLRGEIREPAVIDGALDVVWLYRAAHAYSLTKATMGLRSVVRTEGCELEVSQRLKRMTTILDKLGREPTMRLASMQDIGGCRAVLSTIREVRRVEQRLKKNRPPIRYSDYITAPRESGYRGVHVVVGYGDDFGVRRAIEVQLRTKVMHEWAITVERLSGRLRDDLKSGRGPEELLVLLAAVSEAMALEERGEVVSDALNRRIAELRAAAVPFLRGTHG
jgi:putative GTP pyrophosphokinase